MKISWFWRFPLRLRVRLHGTLGEGDRQVRFGTGFLGARGGVLLRCFMVHDDLPSGYINIAIENDHRNRGFSH